MRFPSAKLSYLLFREETVPPLRISGNVCYFLVKGITDTLLSEIV